METSDPRRSSASSLWTAFVVIVVFVVVVSLVSNWFVQARQKAMRESCLNNLKCIGTSFSMYESDWDDTYPPLYGKGMRAPEGKTWPDLVDAGHGCRRVAICPASWHRLLAYSYNSTLAGMRERDVKCHYSELLLLFDSVNDSPANNNLNGGTIWHAKEGAVPPVGSFVPRTKEANRMSRNWPDWAKPRHGTITNVCFADGHARSIEGWDSSITISPK